MNNKYTKALKAAFPLTLPICAAFLFLGISYGFYICSKGFSPWYPFFTSALVFAGSMEFVLVTMLLSPFKKSAPQAGHPRPAVRQRSVEIQSSVSAETPFFSRMRRRTLSSRPSTRLTRLMMALDAPMLPMMLV